MSSPWRVLGLKSGADEREVRRAYARKLKVTQPEDDPDGFRRLREAYETALRLSRMRGTPDVFDDEEDEDAEQEAVLAAAAEQEHASLEATAEPATRQGSEALADRLGGLLRAGDPASLAQAPEVLQQFLHHEDLELISARTSAERWLATLLAEHVPATDTLIDPVIAFFGWTSRGYAAEHSPAVAYLLQRSNELVFERDQVAAYARRSHPKHRAWKALTSESTPKWRRRLQALSPKLREDVSQLLAQADANPILMARLAPAAVTWWRTHIESGAEDVIGLMPIGLLLAIALAGLVKRLGFKMGSHSGFPIGAVMMVIAFGYVGGLKPRLKRAEQVETSRPWIVATRALALVPVAAVMLPNGALGLAGAIVLAALCLVWRARQPTIRLKALDTARMAWRWIALGFVAVVACAPLLAGTGDERLRWIVAGAALLCLWWPQGAPMQLAVAELSPVRRRVLLAAVAIGAPILLPLLKFPAGEPAIAIAFGLGILIAWGAVSVLAAFERPDIAQTIRLGATILLVFAWVGALILVDPAARPPATKPAGTTPPIATVAPPVATTTAVIPVESVVPPDCQDAAREAALLSPGPPSPCPRQLFKSQDFAKVRLTTHPAPDLAVIAKVSAEGRATDCSVKRSSGVAALDAVACKVILRKGRFIPARDRRRSAIDGEVQLTVTLGLHKRLIPPSPTP